LPGLVMVIPLRPAPVDRSESGHTRIDRLLLACGRISLRYRVPLIAGTLLASGLSVWVATGLRFSHDPIEWLPEGDPLRIATERVNDAMGATTTMDVVVTTGRENGLYEPAVLDGIDGVPGVARVDLDATGSGGLDETRPLIHADEVFESGITGAGRVVAVLDTGVPDDHPDLAGAVLHRHHFLDGDDGPGATDGHGHGTNVTGIIASRGTTSPRGIAPGSSIVAIKVLDDENRGFLSDWAMGVEHAVALHEDGEIRIDAINMSLVSDVVYPGPCDEASFGPLNAACQAALDAGIAIFASSGNTGSSSVMTSPACLSSAYAVGSVSVDRRFTKR